MILFHNDWSKYPRAVPHYKTKNKSWVRLAGVYNAMSVSNCLFHLALHNPLLQDIDPHDPNITPEQVGMVIAECAENPWYMLREVCRVPPSSGVTSSPLRANRGNISLYWLFFNHITTMLIQPRQTGKSISVDELIVALITVLTINTSITLLTKDDALRVINVKRLKDIMEHLPPYLQLKSKKDSNNTEKITLERIGNVYNTMVAQASKKAALKLGRGGTTAINHVDEIAFVNNIETTLPAFLAAAGAARDNAKEANAPYGNLFTTTPGYQSSESGKYAYSIYNSAFRWTELLFDVPNEETLCDHIEKNSPSGELTVLLDYNHRQLGYTDKWLRGKIAESRAKGKAAEADFLGIWPEGSGSTLIPKDKMKIIVGSKVVEPNNMISTYGYIIKWYIPLDKIHNRYCILGLDTSEAIGNDGIGLVIRDISTGEVLGSGDFNETNTITFANWVASLLIEYPDMLLVVERKSTAMSIIDAIIEVLLRKQEDPFKRIFNWVVNDARVKQAYADEVTNVKPSLRDPIVYTKYRKYFGYVTTGQGRSSRDMLYGEIFNACITYTADTVRDVKLINQLSGLIVKNNRIDHSAGNHDDLVIGWLLGYWLLAKGENLDFYGIPKHKVLTSVSESIIEEQGGSEAVEAREFQLELKAEIDELVSEIKKTNSTTKRRLLMNKLRYLYRDIDTTIIQAFNIDTLIENIELESNKSSNVYRRARII